MVKVKGALPLMLASIAGLVGCTSSSDLLLRITPQEGALDAALVVYVADGQADRVVCPGTATTEHLSCHDAGALVTSPASDLDITVKMRGMSFVTRALKLAELPSEGDNRVVELPLTALPVAEKNDDYATGYLADELDLFHEMAYVVDTELGSTRVVKFYIHDVAGETPEVYFQNTKKHPLHYEFVRKVLKHGVPLSEFEQKTYHGEDRENMAGTLVQYVSVESASEAAGGHVEAPITINFFPSDDLTPEQATLAHRLLEERIGFAPVVGSKHRLMYLPAGEKQQTQLTEAKALFARRDALWVLRQELFGGVSLQVLNPGLAYGTLRLLSPAKLASAVVSYKDILVLTKLPNTLPIVGGTITEELQTPLAHVNVAARARGTPNIALLEASSDARVSKLLGKLVRFEVKNGAFTLTEAKSSEAEDFWNRQKKDPITPDFDLEPNGLPGFDEIGFADSVSVGAKAANLAELSTLLDKHAPRGFAIPFSHYDDFMRSGEVTTALCDEARADCSAEGRSATVCDKAHALCLSPDGQPQTLWELMERMLADGGFAVETELREASLDGLRYAIRHVPLSRDFATKLDARVTEVLGKNKVRLRSSTNAEDLPNFSGAGLYSSVSAYGAGATSDPMDLASSEVRKVWASTWNWRAFEERAFWNIDHLAVRMGVAVTQSFPDEAANGVLITQNIADPTINGMYVNVQQGETPVTNPEGGALPEVFSIIPAPAGIQVSRLRFSSLSPDAPILADDEIVALFGAASKVQKHFAPLYEKSPFLLILDLEFKFHGPNRDLYIKQCRPYLQSP